MLLWEGGEGYDRVYYGFDTRVDALLIGCLLALGIRVRRPYPSRRAAAGLFVFALVVVGLLAPAGGPAVVFVLMPTVVAVLTACLISCVIRAGYGGWLASKPLVLIGQRSYALYLWHYLCLSFAWRLTVPGVIQAAAGVALAWVLTALSWRFVEQPFLRRRLGQEREELLARPAPTGWGRARTLAE
jgi:peptidoglycan/LPS O-acetylase OafA/YrhL